MPPSVSLFSRVINKVSCEIEDVKKKKKIWLGTDWGQSITFSL